MAKGELEYVAALDRGLRVLRAFSRERPQLTLSGVAAITGLSPATARRSLHTLEVLGYVARSGRQFLLRPQVLRLSAGYLGAINADVVLQPFLVQLVHEAGGAAFASVLDEDEVVVLAHASTSRAFRLISVVGARFPAYATDMGRVLLSALPHETLDRYFHRAAFRGITEFTETDPARLRALLNDTRRSGLAAIQDELEYGLVSVAIPVMGPDRQVVAAASCADVANHVTRELLIEKRLPLLRQAVRGIEQALARYPELAHSVAAGEPRPTAPPRPRAHREETPAPVQPPAQLHTSH
jgi:IclR family pca regulon transcriptional regulator